MYGKIRVRRGFAEAAELYGDAPGYEELAAREPVVARRFDELPEASPGAARLREVRVDNEVTVSDLRRVKELAPNLRHLACHTGLDLGPAAVLRELGLEGLDLWSYAMEWEGEDPKEVARVWAIPWTSLKLALSAEVKLEQPFRGRRLDFFRCEGPFAPLLEGAPLVHLATAGARIRELARWPGFARIPRLGLYTVPPGEIAPLAAVRLDGLRDLEIDLEPGEFGGRELAAIRKAPWTGALRVLRLHVVEDADELVKLVRNLPRLTTLEATGLADDVIRRIRAAAGPRLVRVGNAHRAYTLDWTECGHI
jgi:hypothetical protein